VENPEKKGENKMNCAYFNRIRGPRCHKYSLPEYDNMCGRYSIGFDAEAIQDRFLTDNEAGFEATYNAAPQQELPVITRSDTNHLELATWGLQPSWAGDDHDGFINARVETADEKPSFEAAWEQNRCLVPASGFYEWSGESGGKTPYYFQTDEDLFSFAGLWTTTSKGKITYTILTRPANDDVKDVHERMPVILKDIEEGSWLLNQLTKEQLFSERPPLTSNAVTKAVNHPENDGEFLTRKRENRQDVD
jgi:putative SOS response-associated peptidase YedK